MRTITVSDNFNSKVLSFDLRDLLSVIEPIGRRMNWRVEGIDYIGHCSEAFHAFTDRGDWLDGSQLIEFASAVDQIIDGYFYGYEPGGAEPALVFRAVDGSSWDISSATPHVLDSIRGHFHVISDIEDMPI